MINKNITIRVAVLLHVWIILFSCKGKTHDNSLAVFDAEEEVVRPNIIVIVADDAGYIDFGFMGSDDLDTPEIDALAADGVIFTDAHVTATVCAPSRAGLITGRYQQRMGFEANGTGDGSSGDIGLSPDAITMAGIFKQNSYKTIALGKWHLGSEASDHPNNRGFDEFYGFLAGSRSYFPLKDPSENKMLQHNGKRVGFKGYLTDILGDRAVQYVEENRDQPFFMYLAYNAVHTPMEAKKDDLEKYKNHPRKELAAMTWSLDENVGKLRKKLKELGLLENTLIYFLSDNGGAHNNQSENGDLKGWKGNEFEGGHRVPFILSWPGNIEGRETFEGLTSSLDIFPTSLAAAGIKTDSLKLDGVNLIPFLKGEKQGDPHEKLFWRKLEEAAVRIGDNKVVRLKNYGSVLYDLENDRGETQDLSTREPAIHQNLMKELESWESQIRKPLWAEESDWMEVTYYIHRQLMQNKPVEYADPYTMRRINSEKYQ
ncbi:sulfatase-like hydrolase/transferase [Christiangramia crocea]|uniref:Sulfatase-like hydrolase/transferase n=1 Tax=Christiangramia crocea TaxID=2904124 RepID=A0A9X2A967_9FLAO|nr:sulfatase-like hydrolase/transferase [Gramella crocea]MCG9972558.1 sulfatase-like hydrolase/transferase [Gramella crocea]